MAIEPINVSGFARNPVGIEAILARGSSAFGSILQGLTQVGRDQANNQQAQERDFLTEQRREIQLKERRGEMAQAQSNSDRRFAEDTRQFGVKFGEGVRQFDTNVENANLDRIQRGKAQDAQIEIGRAGLKEKERSNALAAEDLTFRRGEAATDKARKREAFDVELETAKTNLEKAKGSAGEAQRQRDFDGAISTAQGQILGNFDKLITEGKTDEAKSYFTSTAQLPAYRLPASTLARMAEQVGLGGEKAAGSKAAAIPVAELTDDELEAERERLEDAVANVGDAKKAGPQPKEGTQVQALDQKAAVRLAEIRQLQENRKTSKQDAIDRILNFGR